MLKLPFGLAGMGVGLGLAGEMFDSEGLTKAGETSVGFIPPVIAIETGGYLINQLKEIDKGKGNKKENFFF